MTRPRHEAAKTRLNLQIPDGFRETLENVRKKTDAASITEVIIKAVRVYEAISKSNARLILRYPDGMEKEVWVI